MNQDHVLPAELGALGLDILHANSKCLVTLDGVAILVQFRLDADFDLSL